MTVSSEPAANGNGFTGTFVSEENQREMARPGRRRLVDRVRQPQRSQLQRHVGLQRAPANGIVRRNKVLPPSPITAAGDVERDRCRRPERVRSDRWRCTQSGPSALCHAGSIVINGKFRTKDKVRATWNNGPKSGWFSFWFNGDNNSFNGTWGYGKDTTPAVGRVVGQRALH